ncbi:MAG TPA: cytochrome c peroxidase [Acidimicrobiia bacterium]|nr:cytochrome c peroxidase [Acidimicrobiia bacterium]
MFALVLGARRHMLIGVWKHVLLGCLLVACSKKSAPLTKEQLGEKLFNDTNLSEPAGQACADCHVAHTAFADPEDDRTSAGAIKDRFGTRNAQPIRYAAYVPAPHRVDGAMVGGLFWDGRAASLEDQASGPMLNPLEMNNPSKAVVVEKVKKRYGDAFRKLYGKDALSDVDQGFAHVMEAIAAFERTAQFAPFSSKYDRVLAGKDQLDESEARGLALFNKSCTSCHTNDGDKPLFTNFHYVNLGVPRFNDNPFYLLPPELNPDGAGFIDRGLGKVSGDPREDGMFRVPTLRNVARTTPYGHNGYYRRLDEMIAFHAQAVASPEIAQTVDRKPLAQFQPSTQDMQDLVAFLKTLTDADVN